MNTDEILKLKKLLDEGIISQEEFDREKAKYLEPESKKQNNKKGLIIAVVCVFLFCIIAASVSDDSGDKGQKVSTTQSTVSNVPEEFSAEFPIQVSGKMYDNIIGFPELSLSITNNSNKDINAIQVYFSPKDVYGEEADGIFATKELYTDDTIYAGSSATKAWQMLDNSVKAGEVYVYSIYFADGTEWGDKDAAVSDIKKYGYKIEVKY